MSAVSNVFKLGLIAVVAAGAGLLLASWVFQPGSGSDNAVALSSGTLLPQPRPLPEFKLTDADGKPFDRSSMTGRWSLVFVGFTHCPDVCPSTLALLKTVNTRLQAEKKNLHVVFLSIDPERDTAAALGTYVRYFSPDFAGVTGPEDQLTVLGQAMGFVFAKAPGPTPETYSMDHSSALILVNPQAQVAAYFTPPLKVDALTTDLARVLPRA
ncbi:MAG: SCO family protein [Panacagrimonas sp.]